MTDKQNQAIPKGHQPIIPYLLLGVLIINSAYLSFKYIDFYYLTNLLDKLSLDCGDDCDSVMMSQYALFFGIPTPVFGFVFFMALAATYFLMTTGRDKSRLLPTNKIKNIYSAMLIIGCLVALYLIRVLYFELQMFCKFCMLSHLCLFALTAYHFLRYPFTTN